MTRFPDPIAWEATLPVRPSSPAWRAVVRATYGTPLDAEDRAVFLEVSGGLDPRPGGWTELEAVVGRRGGKSETIARIGVFEAVHGGHEVALAPGQLGIVAVISPLREQSQQIMGYARGLAQLPQVRRHVATVGADRVEFKTGVALQVMTADAVSVSGPTLACVIRDEWAKWPGPESACPDFEIEASLRPAAAPVAGAPPRRFFGITSAYLRDGLAFETDVANFGRPDADVLVVRGSTELFNPAIDRAWLERERRRSPRTFAREYLAEWADATTDGWFGDVIESSVDHGTDEREPEDGVSYWAAIDAAFRGDRFALAICHATDDRGVVLDLCKSWAAERGRALSVDRVVAESSLLLRSYGCAMALADQFAFDPLAALYQRHRITLRQEAWTASSKPARFRLVRDAMTDGAVRLLDDRDLLREFHAISGTLLRSGGERIEAKRGHDDLVHAVVLCMSEAMTRDPHGRARRYSSSTTYASPDEPCLHALTLEDRGVGQAAVARVASRIRGRTGWYDLPQAERRRRFFDD